MLGEPRLQGCIGGGEKVAELIGEARKRAADFVGRQFIEVRGDDASCALDGELHEEGAERQQQRTG